MSPPWPFLDFDTPAPAPPLLPDHTPPHPTPFSHTPPCLPPAPPQSPQLLSSQTSVGTSSSKISKRKSRAVSKPPIRFLSADRESFRDMVQKFTGIPCSPHMDRPSGMSLWGSAGFTPAVAPYRPMPRRQVGSLPELAPLAQQSMPTLDTSSAYLTRGFYHGREMLPTEVGSKGIKSEFHSNEAAVKVTAASAPEPALYDMQTFDGVLADFDAFPMSGSEPLQGSLNPWLPPNHVEIAHSSEPWFSKHVEIFHGA